ncbi:TonB-dependent receptor [Pseudoalteromonas sp. 1181_04]
MRGGFIKGQNVELRADVTNLFNARTNTVTEGFSGVEPGRMYWLGASYNF